MPNINLRDGRNRDAMVSAQSSSVYAKVAYVDQAGAAAKTRKVLKAVGEMSFDKLSAKAGDPDKLADALVAGDGDIDFERIGMFLSDTSRVFVNTNDEIVYQIEQTEIVRGPMGEEKERRARRRAEPNVDGDIPISWTGRKIPKADALRRFVFASKLQIVHVNGLTYDFLYGMAKELADANSLMLLRAGKSGKEPLVFRRGQTPYQGFLEGRIDGDKYMLILHLSKMELKRPVGVLPEVAVAAVAPTVEAPVAVAAPVVPEPVPAPVTTPDGAPIAAAPPAGSHKPTVKEVLAELSGPPADAGAREAVSETVAASKAARHKKTKATVAAKSAAETPPAEGADKPARTPRTPKPTASKPAE